MRPLDRLSDYLGAVERRLRLMTVTRGLAVTAAAALIFTVVAVLLANLFSFSRPPGPGGALVVFCGGLCRRGRAGATADTSQPPPRSASGGKHLPSVPGAPSDALRENGG